MNECDDDDAPDIVHGPSVTVAYKINEYAQRFPCGKKVRALFGRLTHDRVNCMGCIAAMAGAAQ